MPGVSSRLRALAREAVDLVERGEYLAPSGGSVRIGDAAAAAVGGTRLYLPDDELAPPTPAAADVTIEVTGESTLAAARRLGGEVAALVFASAKNRGGGFLNGAQAQEESVARSSALYACLTAAPEFYAYHRGQDDLRYSDRVIYSPRVPTFRDDRGHLLDAPYPVTYLTAAAPNASALRNNQPELLPTVPAALNARAARVLAVAAAHGHRRLVLGAWGCGVFGNDPATVAEAFAGALRQHPYFDHVVFAVFDPRPKSPTRDAFVAAYS